MMRFISVLGVGFVLASSYLAQAADLAQPRACRLVVDAETGKVILRQGPCEVRRSPCSTFKIALAVMGFDSGILKNEHDPVWDYLPEYNSSRAEEKQKTDPTAWELNSVVWFSQKLTRTMGMQTFQKYVDQFDYGNKDLSGNPGKKDGLTQAWLTSSLAISPDEQVQFLRKLLTGKLGASKEACARTEAIIPKFPAADGWILHGKTGSGLQKNADGTSIPKMNQGWFVGWASNGKRKVIFAELLMDETPNADYGGPRARAAIIQALPEIMKGGS